MQVKFVLWFYHSDKTDKMDRLNGRKDEQCSQTPDVFILNLFRVTAGSIDSFRIRSKEKLRIMYPKCPVDMIERIHLRCGSFGSIISFWILVKKWNIRFPIKNPDLDFSEKNTGSGGKTL